MPTPAIDIAHCSVRLGPGFALRDACWRVSPGQHWALLGANGAGKTTLLRLARGEVHPAQGEHFGHRGQRTWDFGNGPTTSALDARDAVALVTADDHDAYRRDERIMTAEDVVLTGIFDTQFLFRNPTQEQRRTAQAALEALGAAALTGREVTSLSRGEGRLVVIARALVRRPRILLLDEAMAGLDAAARQRLGTALERLAAEGTQIVMATHHLAEVRGFITHAAEVGQGRVLRAGPVDEILSKTPASRKGGLDVARGMKAADAQAPEFFVRLSGVRVLRQGRPILYDIDWTLRPGEHWAILGDNGAGKSTLVGLITGAVRPSTGSAQWFGQPEAFNVWDIRRRIGLVSPELQADYRYNVTALEMVLSGYFSSIGLYEQPSPEREQRAAQLVGMVGLDGHQDRPIRTLSYGQQRRLLIARALAPRPELLLLDEPCTGLDPAARAEFLDAVETLAASGLTVVFVTHHLDEIPAPIANCLVLRNGRIAASGPRDAVLCGLDHDGS